MHYVCNQYLLLNIKDKDFIQRLENNLEMNLTYMEDFENIKLYMLINILLKIL